MKQILGILTITLFAALLSYNVMADSLVVFSNQQKVIQMDIEIKSNNWPCSPNERGFNFSEYKATLHCYFDKDSLEGLNNLPKGSTLKGINITQGDSYISTEIEYNRIKISVGANVDKTTLYEMIQGGKFTARLIYTGIYTGVALGE